MKQKDKLIQFIGNNEGQYSYKEIAMKTRVKPGTAKETLKRLANEGLIGRIKKGCYVFYCRNPGDTIRKLEESIILDPGELPKLSRLTFLLKKNYIQGNKSKGGPYDLNLLLNTMSPESIHWRWMTNAVKSELKPIQGKWETGTIYPTKNGFYEKFYFKKGVVTIEVFGTGSIVIFLSTTKYPLDIVGYVEYISFLDAIFKSRTTYSFQELMCNFRLEAFELSRDKPRPSISREGLASRLCATVRDFNGFYHKVYEKEIDLKEYFRREIGFNTDDPNISVKEFANTVLAELYGGPNFQWFVNDVVRTGKTLVDIENRLEKRDLTIEYILRQNQQQGLYIKQFQDSINDVNENLEALYKAMKRKENY